MINSQNSGQFMQEGFSVIWDEHGLSVEAKEYHADKLHIPWKIILDLAWKAMPHAQSDVAERTQSSTTISGQAPIAQQAASKTAVGPLHKQLGALDLSTIELQHTTEFDKALELIDKENPCIFVTGEAGTGKSTLLKYLITNTNRNIIVLAPTGVAALNVGGQTIHSFFQFPRGTIGKPKPIYNKQNIFKGLQTLVIDEISMVRADIIDAIDKSLRLNCGQPNRPFGGVQVVFFGDLFQLPPVVKDEERQFFAQYYKSHYFFDAQLFQEKEIQITIVKLKTIYRQKKDPDFTKVLRRIRNGYFRDDDLKFIDDDLNFINSRVNPHFEPHSNEGYIELTTTKKEADKRNQNELCKLPLPEKNYQAKVTGKFEKFEENNLPTDYNLNLRVGAQVMFLTNDIDRRWLNGTIGLVEEMFDDSIRVRIPTPPEQLDLVYEVMRHTWDMPRYKINHQTRSLESEVIGTFTQFPLKLAWAITIHKGQGKTLDKVIVNLGSGAFDSGQTYVALSRCTSIDGLVLKKPIRKKDIKTDPKVKRFQDLLQNK